MDQKVALVTGGSRGIGRAVAVALASAGFTVAVNYAHARERAAAVVTEVVRAGGAAASFEADVSAPEAVAEMFAAIDARFGRLDVLVNNAGVGGRVDSITDIDDATWRRTLAVNLDGAFYCLRAAIPRMRAAGAGASSTSPREPRVRAAPSAPTMRRARRACSRSPRRRPASWRATASRSTRCCPR